VQAAHDLVEALLSGRLSRRVPAGDDALGRFMVALDVLCWVLGHRRGKAFEANLVNLRKAAGDIGYRVDPALRRAVEAMGLSVGKAGAR
jgi:hypothetical protein